ncbi:MAG: hypothetical protein M3R04_02675, partial [bacterium]|nr:hypothetical protein [bacterium]
VTLLAIFGEFSTATVELVVWLVLVLQLAWFLSSVPRPFLSGFICGMLMGIWSHLLSIALWDTYVVHNPILAKEITDAAVEKNMSLPLFMLLSAPMVGLFYGVLLGLLAWGASKAAHKSGN